MNLSLHHIGYVVKNIEKYEKNLIFTTKIKEIMDEVQQAKLSLYQTTNGSYIELIEPQNETAFTYNFLQSNKGHSQYHHLCYAVANIEMLNKICNEYRLIKILGPVPAILFDNKLVCFYFTKNKEIVEFLIEN